MTIPEVMQRCDEVLVSGRNVSTYGELLRLMICSHDNNINVAIPALQPLVVNLFMRTSLSFKVDQLEAEREVVLMMMFRLLGHHQVVSMCALVLECYHSNYTKWVTLSEQILPVLLPYMAKFDVTTDIHETIASIFRIMSVIAMRSCNIRAVLELLMNHSHLVSLGKVDHVVSCDTSRIRLTNMYCGWGYSVQCYDQ